VVILRWGFSISHNAEARDAGHGWGSANLAVDVGGFVRMDAGGELGGDGARLAVLRNWDLRTVRFVQHDAVWIRGQGPVLLPLRI
jgi:hypothetical protein